MKKIALISSFCNTQEKLDVLSKNIDTIKTENLYEFDGVPRYSLGQGQ